MKTRNYFFGILKSLSFWTFAILFGSCTAYRQLPYLKNVEDVRDTLAAVHEAKIMPNDLLIITVNSTDPEAAKDFNLPMVPNNMDNPIQTSVVTASSSTGTLQNYLVDKNGTVNFPILGKIKIADMTTREAQDYLVSLLYPQYITEKPVVNVRFVNFNISVLGEVARPGIYSSANGQMTIFDALAAAGDMTIYGKRNNVLLTRILANGEVVNYRIDMQDKDLILHKDLFYLQQNDKLYVEMNKARGNSARFGTLETVGLSALSIAISVLAIVLNKL